MSIASGRSTHKNTITPSNTKFSYQFSKTPRFPHPNPKYSTSHTVAPKPSTPTTHNYPNEGPV